MISLTAPAAIVNPAPSFALELLAAYSPAIEARPAPEPTGPTEADDAWWAAQTRDDIRTTDADWDALADNAAAVDALAAGFSYC